jgi:hypothetical protein
MFDICNYTNQPDLFTVAIGFIGAVIGGLFSFLGVYLVYKRQLDNDRRNVAKAIDIDLKTLFESVSFSGATKGLIPNSRYAMCKLLTNGNITTASNPIKPISYSSPIVFLNQKYNILEIDNPQFNKLIKVVLSEISSQLFLFEKSDNSEINIDNVNDAEIPSWVTFVIKIKISSIGLSNYEDFFSLERRIRKSVRDKILISNIQDEEILKKYGNPLIYLEFI